MVKKIKYTIKDKRDGNYGWLKLYY